MAWRVAAAQATGSSHRARAEACQDGFMVAASRPQGALTPPLLFAVADGAGSAPRSAEGTDVVLRALLDELASGRAASLEDGVRAARAAVLRAAEEEGVSPRVFACTLVAVLVRDGTTTIAQVGDGLAAVRLSDGASWTVPVRPQNGAYANHTFFVTDEDALSRLAVSRLATEVEQVAVLTDGLQALCYDRGSPHAPFFDGLIATLVGAPDDDDVSEALERWLTSAAVDERTDDDRSLILASRMVGS